MSDEAAVEAPQDVSASLGLGKWLGPAVLSGVALAVLLADQASKNWVVSNLSPGKTVSVWGEFLQWCFVRNPGAAFSFAAGATWIFTILSTIVVAGVLWQMRRVRSISWAIFLGMLLGGVLGNLTDRLTREPGFPVGEVIDFISTPWMLPAIYNIADISIVLAMFVFVTITLLGVQLDGTARLRNDPSSTEEESELLGSPHGTS